VDAGLLPDKDAVLGDTIKGTLSRTDHGCKHQYYDLSGCDAMPSYKDDTPHGTVK